MKKLIRFAAALALLVSATTLALPDDRRTFEVTVEGEDGLPRTGQATAELVKTDGKTATYTLTRTIEGPTADWKHGTAVVNERTHSVHVSFLRTTSPGIVAALGTSGAASGSEDTARALLTPSRPSEYVFAGSWKADGHTYSESWRELTRLTADIEIVTPTESGSFGPVVTFDAKVAKADHVRFYVDGYPIAAWKHAGRLTTDLHVWQAGWRRFVVKAFAADGSLEGEAETVFLARGIELTPVHGSKLTKARVRVEATPIGLTGVHTIQLRLDGHGMFATHSAPWGADMSLGADGEHLLEAVAYDASGHELARTHSKVTLDTGGAAATETPLPPAHATQLPELAGKPLFTQVPANPRNYRAASGRTIDMIVIHKAEGSLDATTSWFQNPSAKVSAHYCCNDSETAQMVKDQDICWHTGNRAYNERSIGIENEGYTQRDDISEAHYERLAKLVAWLCKKHGIPLDRHHVIGHNEVPNPDWPSRGPHWGGIDGHQDPGPHFDWNKLMTLARAAQTP